MSEWVKTQKIGTVQFESITPEKLLLAIPEECFLVARRGLFNHHKRFFQVTKYLQMLEEKIKMDGSTLFQQDKTDLLEFAQDEVLKNSGGYSSFLVLISRVTVASEVVIKPLSRVENNKSPKKRKKKHKFDALTSTMIVALLTYMKDQRKIGKT
jgi:hypothetical protein